MESNVVDPIEHLAYYFSKEGLVLSDKSDWLKTMLLFFGGFLAVPAPADLDVNPNWFPYLAERGFIRALPDELSDSIVKNGEHFKSKAGRKSIRLEIEKHMQGLKTKFPMLTRAEYRVIERLVIDTYRAGHFHGGIMAIVAAIAENVSLQSRLGFDVEPISNSPVLMRQTISDHYRDSESSRIARILELDLETVTFSLNDVPIEEILDFRLAYGPQFRLYRRHVNRLAVDMASTDPGQAVALLRDRREELRDLADELQRNTRLGFGLRRLMPFGLGLTGAVLTYASGDLLGASGNAVGVMASAKPRTNQLGAYGYLFSAEKAWRGR